VLENADNPGSGGIGDTTGLFRALLAARADVPAVFCFFADPALVARAQQAGVGARIEARLGGRIAPGFGPPVEFSGLVERVTDGRYRNTGPMGRGAPNELGPTCVLADGKIRVIVTSACQSPHDPGLFQLHGIDVTRQRLVCVKAKNHFRAGFRPLIPTMIDVDTPGPASLDQRDLPFRHAPAHLRRA
jgi:microcystin degradation protein MlrC